MSGNYNGICGGKLAGTSCRCTNNLHIVSAMLHFEPFLTRC